MGKVTAVTSLGQFHEIIKSNKHSVFDFWATWCGPCRVISPVFEALSEKQEFEHIDFYKVDVDEQTDISEEVGIRVMPTFLLFKDGQKIDAATGASPPGVEALLAKAK